ncbi:CPBP family intramembrane metalloprotease [Butyrivibrio sp. XB500-5]|uniref:CPBP family intramembrane glutamic endopeptidase n=1 Tax=Butyrivibrio sp. XB500-5 TaxID=2364880 RepID=UPI000EA90AE0|nr:CPBP family intramembrane glutamic endopeptidase [Butyrivibrio sp. XB500-5]RKM58552.1 CPBP family intramembrane metalloprotease [Butyrivibrio sp. XB500-5]
MNKTKYWIGIILFIVSYFATAILVPMIPSTSDGVVDYMIHSIIEVAIYIVFLLAFGLKKSLRFNLKSLGEGIVVGGAFTAWTVFNIVFYMIKGIREYGTPLMGTKNIIIFSIAITIGAGMGEEFLTRGVFFNFIRSAIGNTKAGIITAMTIPSIAFGLIHLNNLVGGGDPTPIYTQVIYAIGIGFFFNALYVRCGNIWVCSILHAVFDLSLMLYFCIFRNTGLSGIGSTVAEWLGYDALILKGIAITVVSVAIGLFLIRDSKLQKCIERYENE